MADERRNTEAQRSAARIRMSPQTADPAFVAEQKRAIALPIQKYFLIIAALIECLNATRVARNQEVPRGIVLLTARQAEIKLEKGDHGKIVSAYPPEEWPAAMAKARENWLRANPEFAQGKSVRRSEAMRRRHANNPDYVTKLRASRALSPVIRAAAVAALRRNPVATRASEELRKQDMIASPRAIRDIARREEIPLRRGGYRLRRQKSASTQVAALAPGENT
jgi:hypothetical protein